jgi:predicted LPLAT superfamily acyltransferase
VLDIFVSTFKSVYFIFCFSQLQNYQIDINTTEEIEKMKRDSRAKAMEEFTEKLEDAYSQV